MKNNLIEDIFEAIQTDDCNTDKQSKKLKKLYEDAPPIEKNYLDEAFMYLCGWSLKTLIEENENADL